MVIFESPHEAWPGSISLPEYVDFTDQMFIEYRDGMNARKDDKSTYSHDMRRKAAFVGVQWVENYGSWDIEAVSLNDFIAWETDPESAKSKLIAWVGQRIAEYYQAVLDPND